MKLFVSGIFKMKPLVFGIDAIHQYKLFNSLLYYFTRIDFE